MKKNMKAFLCGILTALFITGGITGLAETLIDRKQADLDSDGAVNARDVTVLRRGIAGNHGVQFVDSTEAPGLPNSDTPSRMEELTISPDVIYGFFIGSLSDADGIATSSQTTRAHSGWIYAKGLSVIEPPKGYQIRVAHCYNEALERLGMGQTPNGNAELLPGTVWVRITIADAEDLSKDLSDEVDNITLTVQGANISLGRNLADSLYVLANPGVNPEWEEWKNERYSWGFNPNLDKPYVEVYAPLEADMISVRGGGGRWHTQEGNETDYLSTGFANGGHLFEGWNADESRRFTILIGKYDKRMASIYVYASPGLNNGEREYGYVKVGSDNANFGVNFGERSAQFFVPIILSTKRPTAVSPMWETGNDTTVPVGTMYYDKTYDTVMVKTQKGWKKCALTD